MSPTLSLCSGRSRPRTYVCVDVRRWCQRPETAVRLRTPHPVTDTGTAVNESRPQAVTRECGEGTDHVRMSTPSPSSYRRTRPDTPTIVKTGETYPAASIVVACPVTMRTAPTTSPAMVNETLRQSKELDCALAVAAGRRVDSFSIVRFPFFLITD